MPQTRFPLVTDHYYHILNRGVARQNIFKSRWDYKYALSALSYYRFINPPMKLSYFQNLSNERKKEVISSMESGEKYVEIVAFVFMPNHFHLLLKQTHEKGISKFMSQFCNSYSRYFNTKYQRVGPLLQGRFKSVLVETTEQLIHLSRYIHLNPVVCAVITDKELFSYEYSSLPEYMNTQSNTQRIINPAIVLEQFKSKEEYKNFLIDHISYGKELEKIKHITLEDLNG
jgi:putative transposase